MPLLSMEADMVGQVTRHYSLCTLPSREDTIDAFVGKGDNVRVLPTTP